MKFLGAVTASAVLLACPAWAQEQNSQCFERSKMVEALAGKYGEHRVFVGLHNTGDSLIESFANAETGTWTITVTGATGTSCVVAHGSDYQADGPGGEAL